MEGARNLPGKDKGGVGSHRRRWWWKWKPNDGDVPHRKLFLKKQESEAKLKNLP